MILIICTKYKMNPSRTVDATERTRFSKSTPNDLEHIGQGQRSSNATHPLMLLIICTKYRKNPSWTVDATGRTRKFNGQTDRQTDRQGESNIPPTYCFAGGKINTYNENNAAKCSPTSSDTVKCSLSLISSPLFFVFGILEISALYRNHLMVATYTTMNIHPRRQVSIKLVVQLGLFANKKTH